MKNKKYRMRNKEEIFNIQLSIFKAKYYCIQSLSKIKISFICSFTVEIFSASSMHLGF